MVKPLPASKTTGPPMRSSCTRSARAASGGSCSPAGINPEYGKLDAYRMAFAVIDEAVRNAVAVGADPSGSPSWITSAGATRSAPRRWARWSRPGAAATKGACSSARPSSPARTRSTTNTSATDGQRHAIPPTLLISAIGVMEECNLAVTMDLKEAGPPALPGGRFAPAWAVATTACWGGQRFDGEVPPLSTR